MIDAKEVRVGNYVLHKGGVRILPVAMQLQHFELLAKNQAKDFFPIPLKPDWMVKNGFIENKKYYQSPEVREFILTLPVKGAQQIEIRAYEKEGAATYARAVVNEMIISNHIHAVHQLQNLYYALIAQEMEVQP